MNRTGAGGAVTGALARLDSHLDRPVDPRPLALLRIAVGPIVLAHLRPFLETVARGGAYDDVFWQPLLPWAPSVPGAAWRVAIVAAAVGAVAVSFGVATRVTLPLTALLVTGNVLLSRTHIHHNRAFLVLLLLGLAALPAGRVWSVDAWWRRRAGRAPRPPSRARWALDGLRFCLASVYLASGTSKLLDPDWWGGRVTAIRVQRSVGRMADLGVPAWLTDLLADPGVHVVAAKVVVLTELAIGAGLLVPRTRRWAVLLAVAFHLSIEVSASVQIFSYAGIAALLVWADPEPGAPWPAWPRWFPAGRRGRTTRTIGAAHPRSGEPAPR